MEKSCRTLPSVQHCTVALPTPSAGGRGVVHGKVKGAVNNLKSADSGLTPAKREANSLLREATTLTQVSGFTSSGTQAATSCTSHNRSFTSKAVMGACLSVTRMSLPCSFTLRAFGCVMMSVSGARRASHSGSKN